MTEGRFERVAIIGVGLLGASLAHAIDKYGGADSVSLYDADPAVRSRARELLNGTVHDTLGACVEGADCVVLCIPVGAFAACVQEMAPHLTPDCVLTDVGSVKAKAAEDMARHCPSGVHLVPGHPIAGTENSGPEAGFADLFHGAWHILTPADSDVPEYLDAVAKLQSFWERLGAHVENMSPARHDRVLAITSHLPHLIAYNIVSTAYDMETIEEGEVVKFSAGGFRDFTRIAASDPTMWRDVFLTNRDAVLETLGRFSEDLAALQRAIRWNDGDMLFEQFSRARGIRRAIIDAGLDTAEADFGRRSGAPTQSSEDD